MTSKKERSKRENLSTESEEKRKYLKTVGALVAGLAIGGAAGWLSKPVERITERITETVTKTVTVPITPTPTPMPTPTPTPTPTPRPPLTLRWLTIDQPWVKAVEDICVPKYKELMGIDVEITKLPELPALEKIRLELSTGSPTYDIISIATFYRSTFLPSGWLVPLGELEEKTGVSIHSDEFISGVLENSYTSMEGTLYGLPAMMAHAADVCYRKDLFEDPHEKDAFEAQYGYELKVPETWEQYRDVCEFFTRPPDLYGTAQFLEGWGPALDHWLMRVNTCKRHPNAHKFFSYFFAEDYTPTFNTPETVKALEDIVYLYQQGHDYPGALERDWPAQAEPMMLGKVAIIYNWMECIVGCADPTISAMADKVAFDLVPYYPGGQRCTFQGSWCITINKFAKHQEEAFKFVLWFLNPENDLKTTMTGLRSPVLKSTYENTEVLEKFPQFKVIYDAVSNYETVGECIVPTFDVMMTRGSELIQSAVKGEISAGDALDQLEKYMYDQNVEAGLIK